MLGTILLVVLLLVLLGAIPHWPYNGGWRYAPASAVTVVLVVVIVLLLIGRL